MPSHLMAPTPAPAAEPCLECGSSFVPLRKGGVFCCASCRQAWNNRRMARGAELYDLFMAIRHERGTAQLLGLWSLICRMAYFWKQRDESERGGRKSWGDPKEVADRNNRYRAVVMEHRKR